MAAIARAMHMAHQQGITHQDLKPRKVLIDRESLPRVIDFGMAWSRPWWVDGDSAASIDGTLSYFSPEHAFVQADRIGPATDIFGLGVILYFLLAGKPLDPGDNRFAVCNKPAKRRSIAGPWIARVSRRDRERST